MAAYEATKKDPSLQQQQLLLAKIKRLSSSEAQVDECYLTAIVLLGCSGLPSRVLGAPDDGLLKFALKLLTSASLPKDEFELLYIRLVSRAACRMEIPNELGSALLRVLQNRQGLPLDQVDLDLITSLRSWTLGDGNNGLRSELLTSVWNRYQQLPKEAIGYQHHQQQLDEHTSDDSGGIMEDTDSDTDAMRRTIQALLEKDDDPKWKENIHKQVAQLFEYHIVGIDRIPSFWHEWIEWLFAPNLDLSVRQAWISAVLLGVQTLLLRDPSFLQNTEASLSSNLIQKMLLSLLTNSSRKATTITEDSAWASMAWTTWAILAEQKRGFHWILRQDQSSATASTTWGRSSYLCALIRLASGEWRILLSSAMAQSDSQNAASLSDNKVREQRLATAEGCARVLLALVDFLAKEDEPSVSTLTLDAISHIRRSLVESLTSTLDYFQNEDCSGFDKDVDPLAIRLLGTLLPEFWEDQLSRHEHNALQAMQNAVRVHRHGQGEALLPSLVLIVSSYSFSQLRQYNLLGETMVNYMEHLWEPSSTSNSDLSWIPWLCRLVEYWYSHQAYNNNEPARISSSIVTWMQQTLKAESRYESDALTQALSSAVGAFVTLRGDTEEPPNDFESQLIQCALNVCAKHRSPL